MRRNSSPESLNHSIALHSSVSRVDSSRICSVFFSDQIRAMAPVQLKIRDKTVAAKILVFDKDGTLIDFHQIWGPRLVRGGALLKQALLLSDDFLAHLYRAAGYDRETGLTYGQGPLATAPIRKFETIVASVLFQQGISWDEACQLSEKHMTAQMTAPPADAEIIPRGEVARAMDILKAAGCALAVATTDNRLASESAIRRLGIESLLSDLRCGDDQGPVKPDIEVLNEITRSQGLAPSDVIMVGDTVSDLIMARNAKIGLAVGILGGAGSEDQLRPYADVLIESIEEIQPA